MEHEYHSKQRESALISESICTPQFHQFQLIRYEQSNKIKKTYNPLKYFNP